MPYSRHTKGPLRQYSEKVAEYEAALAAAGSSGDPYAANEAASQLGLRLAVLAKRLCDADAWEYIRRAAAATSREPVRSSSVALEAAFAGIASVLGSWITKVYPESAEGGALTSRSTCWPEPATSAEVACHLCDAAAAFPDQVETSVAATTALRVLLAVLQLGSGSNEEQKKSSSATPTPPPAALLAAASAIADEGAAARLERLVAAAAEWPICDVLQMQVFEIVDSVRTALRENHSIVPRLLAAGFANAAVASLCTLLTDGFLAGEEDWGAGSSCTCRDAVHAQLRATVGSGDPALRVAFGLAATGEAERVAAALVRLLDLEVGCWSNWLSSERAAVLAASLPDEDADVYRGHAPMACSGVDPGGDGSGKFLFACVDALRLILDGALLAQGQTASSLAFVRGCFVAAGGPRAVLKAVKALAAATRGGAPMPLSAVRAFGSASVLLPLLVVASAGANPLQSEEVAAALLAAARAILWVPRFLKSRRPGHACTVHEQERRQGKALGSLRANAMGAIGDLLGPMKNVSSFEEGALFAFFQGSDELHGVLLDAADYFVAASKDFRLKGSEPLSPPLCAATLRAALAGALIRRKSSAGQPMLRSGVVRFACEARDPVAPPLLILLLGFFELFLPHSIVLQPQDDLCNPYRRLLVAARSAGSAG